MNTTILVITIFIVFYYLLNNFNWKLSHFSKFKNTNFTKTVLKKRKILIITAEDRNDEYIKLHDINFKKYSDIHGYTYLRLNNCSPEESSTYWCKIHKVKQGLEFDEYDYVIWCDSDTIITDYQIPFDYFIDNYGDPDIICGLNYGDSLEYIINCINAGVFLIKNSELGKSFIDDCLNEISKKSGCIKNGKEQGVWSGECYEEGVMNNLIRTNKYKNNIYIDINKDFIYHKTRLISPYNKIRFITHLPGYTSNERANFFKTFV